MNFKKYHVSRNLLPSDSVRYEYAIRYGNEVITFSGGAMYIVPIENGETYTVKIHTPNVSVSVIRLALYEQLTPSSNTTAYSTQEILNTIEPTLTITNSENKPYLIIQIAGAYVNDYGIDDVMLNEDSTALPYEPYSSEVWHDIPHYIHNTSTDTITTLPAVLYPNDTTATVELKGQTEQSGTPTPTTPIQPQSCGERTGNLLNYTTVGNTQTATATQITNGISISGKYFVRFRTVEFIIGRSYTMAWTAKTISGKVTPMWRLHYSDNTYSSLALNGESLVADKEVSWLLLYINGSSTENGVAEFTDIMLNTGLTPQPYEPYGYKIPILNNSQTTNVYLGEVETTRNLYCYVCKGTEDEAWAVSGTGGAKRFYNTLPPEKTAGNRFSPEVLCTHFVKGSASTSNGGIDVYDRNIRINALSTGFSELTDFKTWLAAQYAAGTPVTVWYVLATPETATLDEPLMKIGDYADTVSGITIPTIAGVNTISIGTTLQPSEVSVNYHGWHPVVDVHERENGAWT